MSTVTLFHNPRCSKSRETLALLEARSITPKIIEYLKDAPSAVELRAVLGKLGIPARDLLRRKEARFAELGLGDHLDDEDALIDAMARNPILIERPIVVVGGKARIGRPPERVLELLP